MLAHRREVHDALNKARHGCERRREGEAAVSRERPVSYVVEVAESVSNCLSCQLSSRAALHFLRPCPVGFVMLNDTDELVEDELDESLREQVRSGLKQACALVMMQGFPEPTPVRARCTQCEYRNFCGDVF